MPFDIAAAAGNAAISTGTGFFGGLLGQVFAKKNDKRQLEMQEKLNHMALASNKEMANYNMQNQMKLWENTNYAAQREQLEKAGLNPGLLYGMSGGGGATTNAAQGSGVSAGHAPTGGGEIMAMTMLGMQQQLMQAQIQKTKAETGNIQADTLNKPLTGQNIIAGTASITQGIENAKALETLTKIQTRTESVKASIAEDTKFEATESAMANFRRAEHELSMLLNEEAISDATYNDKIKIIAEESLRMMLQNKQIQAQTKLTEEQAKAIPQQLSMQNFSTEVQANYPGLFNVLGKQINDLINGIIEKAGGGRAKDHRTEQR